MRTRTLTAAIALLVLALTGCSDDQEPASAETPDATVNGETVAPLVAEDVEEPEVEDAEAAFLEWAREKLDAWGPSAVPNATDEQLLAAAAEACERIAAGEPLDEIVLIEGEEPRNGIYYSSSAIRNAAELYICD